MSHAGVGTSSFALQFVSVSGLTAGIGRIQNAVLDNEVYKIHRPSHLAKNRVPVLPRRGAFRMPQARLINQNVHGTLVLDLFRDGLIPIWKLDTRIHHAIITPTNSDKIRYTSRLPKARQQFSYNKGLEQPLGAELLP